MRYNLQAMGGDPYVTELKDRATAAVDAYRAQWAAAPTPIGKCVATRRFERQAAEISRELATLSGSDEEADSVRRRAAAVEAQLQEERRAAAAADGALGGGGGAWWGW